MKTLIHVAIAVSIVLMPGENNANSMSGSNSAAENANGRTNCC
jgi:hypothetical protein